MGWGGLAGLGGLGACPPHHSPRIFLNLHSQLLHFMTFEVKNTHKNWQTNHFSSLVMSPDPPRPALHACLIRIMLIECRRCLIVWFPDPSAFCFVGMPLDDVAST